MPYNGVGVFQRIYNWTVDAAAGLFIDSNRMDTDTNDIASGLTNCVTRDGQSPWTQNLPAGGFKLTGLGSGSNNGDSVNYGQVFNSPAFNTPSATSSPPASDNSLKLATTAMVQQVAFSAALPAQPAGATPYPLITRSGIAGWGGSVMPRSPRTSNTQLGPLDSGQEIEFTSGTFTQTFAACATLQNGWWVLLKHSGTGRITLDPNGSETIDGLTSFIMYPGEVRAVFCDGTALYSTVLTGFAMIVTANETITTPPGYVFVEGEAYSGGASGQRTNSAVTISLGGASAGAAPFSLPTATLGASFSIVIGQGGAAVTGVAIGNPGTDTIVGPFTVLGAAFNIGGGVRRGASNSDTGFSGVQTSTGSSSSVWGGTAPSNNASADGGSCVYGSGCGGSVDGSGNIRLPGTTMLGGPGGAASIAGNGGDGIAPGGGGGATQTGTRSGAGARGEVRIRGRA